MVEEQGYKFGFWIVTVMCGVWLVALTQGVVANDRIRVSENTRIETEIKIQSERFYQRLEDFQQKLAAENSSIIRSLARIETKLNMEVTR